MPPTGFEPAIPASVRPQTHALDRAATGIDYFRLSRPKYLPQHPTIRRPHHPTIRRPHHPTIRRPQHPTIRHPLPVLSQYPPFYAWKTNYSQNKLRSPLFWDAATRTLVLVTDVAGVHIDPICVGQAVQDGKQLRTPADQRHNGTAV
jgi:hypothetical protein